MDRVALDQIWKMLNEPIRDLQTQVRRAVKLAQRAEVAGAFEVVTALPSAGQKGRAFYLESGDANEGVWYDHGSTWAGPY